MDKNDAGSAADRLADLRDKVEPVAKGKAAAAAAAATEAARTYGPVVAGKAQQAAEVAKPTVTKARLWARPKVEQSVDKAADALETLAPRVDAAREALLQEIVPKLSMAVATLSEAASNAREQAAELAAHASEVAARASEQSRAYADQPGDADSDEPSGSGKDRDRKGGGFLFLGFLAAAGAAAAAALGRKPKEDPWAVPTAESGAVTVPSAETAVVTPAPDVSSPAASTVTGAAATAEITDVTAPPVSPATVTADLPPRDVAADVDTLGTESVGTGARSVPDVAVPERDPATGGAHAGQVIQHSPYEMGVIDEQAETGFETPADDDAVSPGAARAHADEPLAGEAGAADDVTRREGRGGTERI